MIGMNRDKYGIPFRGIALEAWKYAENPSENGLFLGILLDIRGLMLYSTSNTQAMKAHLLILVIFIGIVSPLGAQETIWNLKTGNKFLFETLAQWTNQWEQRYSIREVIGDTLNINNGRKYAIVISRSLRPDVANPMNEDSVCYYRTDGLKIYRWYGANVERNEFSDSLTQDMRNRDVRYIGQRSDFFGGMPVTSFTLSFQYIGGSCTYGESYTSPFGLTYKGRACTQLRLEQRSELKSALIDGKLYGDTSTFQRLVSVSSPQENSASIAPNPFSTDLRIQWNQHTEADIEVLDALGRTLRQFQARPYEQIRWDGTDNNGLPLGTGLYWLRIKTATTLNVIKVFKTP